MNKDGQKTGNSHLSTFDTFFLTWQPKLLFFIEHFMKDHEAARDLCQDIFMKIWSMRAEVAALHDPENYMFRMARNAIFNYFEHNKVIDRYITETIYNKDKTVDAEQQVFAAQLRDMINLTIAEMPEQRKKVWQMSREQGMKNEEIAQALNISKRTVENHLSNALRELRKTAGKMMSILLILP